MSEQQMEDGTHPTGDNQIVDAYQILVQLQQLLEVLHLDQAGLELLHHLGHVGQSGCRRARHGQTPAGLTGLNLPPLSADLPLQSLKSTCVAG